MIFIPHLQSQYGQFRRSCMICLMSHQRTNRCNRSSSLSLMMKRTIDLWQPFWICRHTITPYLKNNSTQHICQFSKVNDTSHYYTILRYTCMHIHLWTQGFINPSILAYMRHFRVNRFIRIWPSKNYSIMEAVCLPLPELEHFWLQDESSPARHKEHSNN